MNVAWLLYDFGMDAALAQTLVSCILHGSSMGCVWILHGSLTDYAWILYESEWVPMTYVWILHASSMDFVWLCMGLHRLCMNSERSLH